MAGGGGGGGGSAARRSASSREHDRRHHHHQHRQHFQQHRYHQHAATAEASSSCSWSRIRKPSSENDVHFISGGSSANSGAAPGGGSGRVSTSGEVPSGYSCHSLPLRDSKAKFKVSPRGPERRAIRDLGCVTLGGHRGQQHGGGSPYAQGQGHGDSSHIHRSPPGKVRWVRSSHKLAFGPSVKLPDHDNEGHNAQNNTDHNTGSNYGHNTNNNISGHNANSNVISGQPKPGFKIDL